MDRQRHALGENKRWFGGQFFGTPIRVTKLASEVSQCIVIKDGDVRPGSSEGAGRPNGCDPGLMKGDFFAIIFGE